MGPSRRRGPASPVPVKAGDKVEAVAHPDVFGPTLVQPEQSFEGVVYKQFEPEFKTHIQETALLALALLDKQEYRDTPVMPQLFSIHNID